MRLSDYVFSRIENLGIRNVYGVTGRGSLYLSDSVAKNENLNWVAMHHEQAAGFAAVAESQFRKRPSIALVSSGCASTNLITPVLLAWQDFLPTIFISGQHFSYETQFQTGAKVRTFGQQETEIVSLVKPITKWASMLTDKNKISEMLDEAFEIMLSGRKGPIWLDIPLDLQSANVDFDAITNKPNPKKTYSIKPNFHDSNSIIDRLNYSKKPLILIGSGVEASGASLEVEMFSERHKIPIIYANTAVDTISSEVKTNLGSLGSMGCSRTAALALSECDYLLVLGHRLNTFTTGPNKELFAENAYISIVDIDFTEVEAFNPPNDQKIHCDIKILLEQLSRLEITSDFQSWFEKCDSLKSHLLNSSIANSNQDGIDLYELSNVLSDTLPDNSVVITDSGYPEVILPTNMRLKRGQKFLHPSSQGSMGYALPAAVAAAKNTNEMVCVVVGDGSIMMNIQELQTLSHYQSKVLILVINNNAYGIIRKRQDELFRGRTIGTHSEDGVSCPDFELVARAFEFSYEKIENARDLSGQIKKIVSEKKAPLMCEINGLWNQDYPRVGTRSDSRIRLARLEDQEPFMDIEYLKSFLA